MQFVERALINRPFLASLIAAGFSMLGLYFVVGTFLFSPNTGIYAFGGDALVLYYNMIFHVLHSEHPSFLGSMLYPHQELIYLTDAQGALATLLWYWHRYVGDLSGHLIGIIHSVNNLSVGIGAMLLYKCCDRLNTSRLLAVLLVPLVIIMSPQMLRFGGHFGLAYPFLIPMVILWVLRSRKKPDAKDFLGLLVLLFFTFNNPYVGFSAALLGLGAIGIGQSYAAVIGKSLSRSSLLTFSLLAIGLLLPYIVFKSYDPFVSRIDQQWGALVFRTDLEGSFWPFGTILGRLFKVKSTSFESIQYVGIVALISVLSYLIFRAVGVKFSRVLPAEKRESYGYLLISSILIYILCYKVKFPQGVSFFIEDYAGSLLLFKAIARIAWSFYFIIALSGIIILTKYFRWLSEKSQSVYYIALISLVALNLLDFNSYTAGRYPKRFSNRFDTELQELWVKGAQASAISTSSYEAILAVPRQLAWNSNVWTDWLWHTNYATTMLSTATGIPKLNGHLGRSPVKPLLDVTQFMSRPEIPRGFLLDTLDLRTKKIALVVGHDITSDDLTPGERFLLSNARLTAEIKKANVYTLDFDSLIRHQSRVIDSLKSIAIPPFYALGFNEEKVLVNAADYTPGFSTAYAGESAKLIRRGSEIILDTIFNSLPQGQDSVSISLWVGVSTRRYDVGRMKVNTYSRQNESLVTQEVETRRSGNTHNGWYLIEATVPYLKGQRLKLEYTCTQDILIDELEIKASNMPSIREGGSILNNVLIDQR